MVGVYSNKLLRYPNKKQVRELAGYKCIAEAYGLLIGKINRSINLVPDGFEIAFNADGFGGYSWVCPLQ
jgi:hypothetical protein